MELDIMAQPSLLRTLREHAGLKQAELAEKIGISQAQLSRNEKQDRFAFTYAQWLEAGPLLALGERLNDDEQPCYLLAAAFEGPGRLRFLFDERAQLGVFYNGEHAQRGASILAELHVPHPRVVPCWPSYTVGVAADVGDGKNWYIVDTLDETPGPRQELAAMTRTAEYVTSISRGLLFEYDERQGEAA